MRGIELQVGPVAGDFLAFVDQQFNVGISVQRLNDAKTPGIAHLAETYRYAAVGEAYELRSYADLQRLGASRDAY